MAEVGWKEGETLAGSRNAPENERLSKLLSDGLHFLPSAYALMHEALMALIRDEWPDQDPKNLPFVHPVYVKSICITVFLHLSRCVASHSTSGL